jgi:hypothetical protein
MRDLERSLVGLGFFLGFVIGFASLFSDDMPIIAVLLFLAAAVLGFAQPAGAWRWGLTVGLAVPCVTLAAWVTHLKTPYGTSPAAALSSAIALVFTIAGSYARALTARLTAVARN